MKSDGKLNVLNFIRSQGILIALVGIYVIFAIISPQFRSIENATLILRQITTIGVMAAGMTFVIVGGEFDLTVGSLLSLCTVLMIGLHDRIGPIGAILIVLVVGIISGFVSGFFVGYLRLNSMIVTLGMMNVLQAIALMVTGGKTVYLKNTEVWFTKIGMGSVGIFPYSAMIMLIYIIIMEIVISKKSYGWKIKAVGGNSKACRYSGIDDRKIKMESFLLSGLSTAIAAILLASRGGSAQPTVGESYEFDVITAVILGGASLAGGSGNVYKTFIGVLILGILKNGFVMLGLPYYIQWVAQCLIMLAAVYIDLRSRRKGTVV